MERFASGWKHHYYGKGDVSVYRLNRDAKPPAGQSAVFGANVLMLTYGEAFGATYATGDNTGLVATDSMKNFVQRETMNYPGDDLADYCRFLGTKFLDKYPQAEGVQVSASEIPYAGLAGGVAFAPGGPERAVARVELAHGGAVVEATSGVRGFRLLRLGGSAFVGFVRDEYTTLPEITNRPLHMWLDLEWRYTRPASGFATGDVARVRQIVHETFCSFESGSIQQVIHQMGSRILRERGDVAEVHLEANNRTWDTIDERGDELGIFTDARPPYGCLGLTLKR